MWPAEVTALELASPLHLSVSLARNGPASYTHTNAHAHIHRKTVKVRWRERKGK